MKKKIILIILGVIVLIFATFFTTDLIRAKNNEKPIFAIEVTIYNDGGSMKHVGLFYNVYEVYELVNDEGHAKHDNYVEITPWFVSIDKVKEKHNK